MTINLFRLLLGLLSLLYFSTQAQASSCLVLGDNQSAYSIEKNRGLIPTLETGLKAKGIKGIFYALKGSGANDWIIAPEENKNILIGKNFTNGPDQLVPFQRNGEKIALNQTGRIPFIDQLYRQHEEEDIDCFMIQLGDNDLFRDEAPKAISEIVKHIQGKEKAPRLCRIIGPSFKEEGTKDQYPFITNQKKDFYMTKLRHHLQKENLLESCPLVNSLNEELKDQLNTLTGPYTYDGLYFNGRGGELWAQNILKKIL